MTAARLAAPGGAGWRGAAPPALIRVRPVLIVVGLTVLASMVARAVFNPDADVAWLLIAAGRLLDGAVPYRDIIEPNPPASILLYVPAVLLGRLTGLSPEQACDGLVAVAAILALAGTIELLTRAGLADRERAGWLWCLGLPLLLVLPLASFGQREHVAVIAMLPALACLAIRSREAQPGLTGCVLAGVAAGLAVTIKPFFALALVAPAIGQMVDRRSWRVALAMPELWIAAALVGLYGAAVAVLMPDYAQRMLPLVVDIYVPARNGILVLLVLPCVWVWLAFVVTAVRLGGWREPFARTLLLGSAGFMACYFIQGKGFYYHALPAVVTAGLAAAAAFADRALARPGAWRAAVMNSVPALLGLLIGLHLYGFQDDDARLAPGLRVAVESLSSAPRLLAIGNDSEIGPVFARLVGGTWVGSAPVTWVTLYAALIASDPEHDPRFAAAIRDEKARYADDIDGARPDLVLIESDAWAAWARRSPALAEALSAYDEVGRYGTVLLLRRARLFTGLRPSLVTGIDPEAEKADRP